MSNEWTNVTQEEYEGAFGFSCIPACGSRNRAECDCNICNVLEMMQSMPCPWCGYVIGSTEDERGTRLVKKGMGEHLARAHKEHMLIYPKWLEHITAQYKKPEPEDTNEYTNWRRPLGYIQTYFEEGRHIAS